MNINLTHKEYRLLLDAVMLAEWISTAHADQQTSDDDPHQMLFQKLYSYAGEYGFASLVGSATDSNRYYPTRDLEEASQAFDWIETYDDLVFWEELIERLAERDVYASLPRSKLDKLDARTLRKHAEPHERRYSREFSSHGLDRVMIKSS